MRVAEVFGKRHDHVTRDIEKLVGEGVPNFGETSYTDSLGRPQKMYLMDRDGFSLLAMGFTGKKALQWKMSFFDAFEALERKGPKIWTDSCEAGVGWRHLRPPGDRPRLC